MKKTFKKFLIGCLFVGLTAASAVGAALTFNATAKTIPLVIDYFDVYKTDLQSRGVTASNSKGIVVTAEENGAYTKVLNNFVERFNSTVELMTSDSYVFTTEFEDVGGEKFALKIYKQDDVYYAFVEIAGKKAGIYYVGTNGDAGLTNLYNNSGEFTFLGGRTSFAIAFDNVVGDVTINGKKVWNVYKDMIDGRQMNAVGKFSNYSVKYSVEEIGQPVQFCMISVNSQTFEGVDFKDTQSAQMDMELSYNALVGTKYSLPEATAIDFGDGDITSKIVYSVKDPDGARVVLSEENGLKNFTPSKAGKYIIDLSVTDARGNTASRIFELTAKETQFTDYRFSQAFEDATVGVNATIVVPSTKILTDLALQGDMKYANFTVYKGTEVFAGYDNLSAEKEQLVCLTETGEYSFVFFDGDNDGVDAKTVCVTVDGRMMAYSYIAETEYFVGDRISVPEVKAYLNGQSYDMEAVIRTPDGALYSNASMALPECGNYTFVYSVEIDGVQYVKEEPFSVYDGTENMFTTEFASVTYGASKYHNGLVGLNVETSANGVLTLNRLIDISELTKDNLLFDILVTPTVAGTAEFTTLLVTLTDANNPENYVVFRARDAYTNSYQKTFMQGRADNQQFAGYSYTDGALQTADMSGTVIEHSFNGHNAAWYYPVYNNTIKVCYDNAEKAMYVPNQSGGEYLVTADFDDPAFFTNIWNGFTSDKVKLSISVDGVVTKAHFLIKSILGYDFSTAYQKDEIAPEIAVEVPEKMPFAKVGTAYSLFNWVSKDTNTIVDEGVKVYLDAENKREIPVVDGKFVPILAGNYTVEYYAEDSSGNMAYKTFVVTAKADITPISISLNNDGDAIGSVGKRVQLPTYTLSDSGYGETVNVTVALGDVVCELQNGGFMPTAEGALLPL